VKTSACIFTACLLLPTAAFTQQLSVKAGLWEHRMELKSDSGRLELALETVRAQMAQLPPAQRQMMEGMLTQQGIKLDIANQTFQNCVTEEEAAAGEFKFAEEGGCTYTSIRNEGTTSYVSYVCAQGQGDLAMHNGSDYTGNSTMTLDFNGTTENVSATHSGSWLGASCPAF